MGPLLPRTGQQGLTQTPGELAGRSWAINAVHCPGDDTQINPPLSTQLHAMAGDGSGGEGGATPAQFTLCFLRAHADKPAQFWRKDRKLIPFWRNGVPGNYLPNCRESSEVCAPETRPRRPFSPQH